MNILRNSSSAFVQFTISFAQSYCRHNLRFKNNVDKDGQINLLFEVFMKCMKIRYNFAMNK